MGLLYHDVGRTFASGSNEVLSDRVANGHRSTSPVVFPPRLPSRMVHALSFGRLHITTAPREKVVRSGGRF